MYLLLFFLTMPRPPISTLFPYTTLFRSHAQPGDRVREVQIHAVAARADAAVLVDHRLRRARRDRKSTRLNSSHLGISYAVFCLKKKKKKDKTKRAKVPRVTDMQHHKCDR